MSSDAAQPENSGPEVFDVEMRVIVRVKVKDPLVISRPVENTDGWRDDLYDLRTRDQVLEMLASNAVRNGVWTAKRLDGWADLADDAAEMDPYEAELESVYVVEGSKA